MSRTVEKHKFVLIPICLLFAITGLFYGLRRLEAQPPPETPPMEAGIPGAPGAPAPGVAGAPGAPGAPAPAGDAAAPAPAAPSEPTFGLSSVLPAGVKSMKIKNWDGTVTEFLRFKYRTMDGSVITVHLPAVYKKEKRTRASWDTLFRVFAMDEEARIDAAERNRPPDVSAYMNQFMAEFRGEVPEGTTEAQHALGQAMDFARSNIPSMGMELPPMPTALPGMF